MSDLDGVNVDASYKDLSCESQRALQQDAVRHPLDPNIVSLISNDEDVGTRADSLDKQSQWFMLAEMLFCFLFLGLGHSAPKIIFQIRLFERTIPYQVTENNEVIYDQYINRPLVEKETVPDWVLVAVFGVLPLFIIIGFAYKSAAKYDINSGVCSYCFAIASSEFITNFVKLYAGYFRPNFYSYCEFSEDDFGCELDGSEPRKSFPSGHASLSFCSMTFLTLYFYGKIGLHRRSPCPSSIVEFSKRRMLSAIITLPIFLAVFVAASRVRDDYHHPADVVGGSLIGLVCAWNAYGLW